MAEMAGMRWKQSLLVSETERRFRVELGLWAIAIANGQEWTT